MKRDQPLLVKPLSPLRIPPPSTLLHPDSGTFILHHRATLSRRVDHQLPAASTLVLLPLGTVSQAVCVWVATDNEAGPVGTVHVGNLRVLCVRLAIEVRGVTSVGYAQVCRRPVWCVKARFVHGGGG